MFNRRNEPKTKAADGRGRKEKKMEEIGKLIHELFDDLRKENAELKLLEEDRRMMAKTLEKVAGIIAPHVTKSHTGEWYLQGIWDERFEELINLLGIEKKEEEE